MIHQIMSLGIKSFYGKRKSLGELEIRLARQEKNAKKRHTPEPYKSRIRGPSQVWQVFRRQQDALNYANRWPQGLHVFSFESSSLGEVKGQRLFLVASYEVFWHYYRQLSNPQRHHYEVIAEGSPCRLYFDLEFSKEHNPDADGNAMTETFIKLILAALKVFFNVECTMEQVLQLNATTSSKYSCHLVFTHGTLVFQDNIQAGHFVKHVLSQLWSVLQRHPQTDSTSDMNSDQKHCRNHEDDYDKLVAWCSNSQEGGNETCAASVCEICRSRKSCHQCASESLTSQQSIPCHLASPKVFDIEKVIKCPKSTKHSMSNHSVDAVNCCLIPASCANCETSISSCRCMGSARETDGGGNMRLSKGTCYHEDRTVMDRSHCGADHHKTASNHAHYINKITMHSAHKETSHCPELGGTHCLCHKLCCGGLPCDCGRSFRSHHAHHSVPSCSPTATDPDAHQSNSYLTVADKEDVKHITGICKQAGLCLDDLQALVVGNIHGEKEFFIDTGVYTKNRNFRIYLSSKLGKDNPLVLSARNQWQPEHHFREGDLHQQIFHASLVSNVNLSQSSSNITFLDEAKDGSLPKTSHGKKLSKSTDSLIGYQQSPYPEIDAFVTSTLTRGGIQGAIRKWAYFSDEEIITYDILHNRWCERIQRQHKSNNIIIVVNLRHGIYYQKCHDPDCKAMLFKSQDYPLPTCVMPAAILGEWDNESDFDPGDLDDDDLLAAMDDLEHSLETTPWELTDEELIKLSDNV